MSPELVNQCYAIQPKPVIIITDMTGRGPLRARIVPQKTRINADYYRDHLRKLIFEKELPKVYPGKLHKVLFHQGKALSHMAHKTSKWKNYERRTALTIKGRNMLL